MKKLVTVIGLLWAFGFLFILYQYSENGRYQIRGGEDAVIIDTRTGAIYQGHGDGSETKRIAEPIR